MLNVKIFVILLLAVSFSCQNLPENSVISIENSLSEDSLTTIKDTVAVKPKNISVDYTDSLNYVDNDGYKQGKHITKNEWGRVIETATYKNDTIVGYYTFFDRMKNDGFYDNGKRHGDFKLYYEDGTILLITHFERDSIIWSAPYIANKKRIVPIKPIRVYVDSAFVAVNHPNKKVWYKGLFINNEPVGLHNVYYDFGIIKGIINYDSLIYTKFDSTGNKVETKNFKHY